MPCRVLRRLDCWAADYVLGLQKNARLLQHSELASLALADQYQARGTKQRLYGDFDSAADSWDRPRRVIARLEHGPQGANPRFIVTSLQGDPKYVYDKRYCGRGEAENRIKEAQLDLFGRRASCHRLWANQLRLLLAALAYTLMIQLRRQALVGTEPAQACTATIRVKLLKIAAAIVRNTRRVHVLQASSHPMRSIFASAAQALAPQAHSSAVPGTLTNNAGKGAVRPDLAWPASFDRTCPPHTLNGIRADPSG